MSKRFYRLLYLALFVEGDDAAESDQLMMEYNGQEMTLYEVCMSNVLC